MTREEAIDALWRTDHAEINARTHEAVEMAIKLLRAEPCEDCISRQTVLEDAKHFMDAFFNGNGKMMYSDHILCEADCKNLMEWIKSFPSVNPTRPKGEWIVSDDKCDAKIWRKCSVCNYNIEKFSKYVNYTGAHYFEKTINFCPICGADMRGKK